MIVIAVLYFVFFYTTNEPPANTYCMQQHMNQYLYQHVRHHMQ